MWVGARVGGKKWSLKCDGASKVGGGRMQIADAVAAVCATCICFLAVQVALALACA